MSARAGGREVLMCAFLKVKATLERVHAGVDVVRVERRRCAAGRMVKGSGRKTIVASSLLLVAALCWCVSLQLRLQRRVWMTTRGDVCTNAKRAKNKCEGKLGKTMHCAWRSTFPPSQCIHCRELPSSSPGTPTFPTIILLNS